MQWLWAVLKAFKAFTTQPSGETHEYEKDLPEDLKSDETYPVTFQGEKTSWTIVEKVRDAKSFIIEGKDFFYGYPPVTQITRNVVTVKQSFGFTIDKEGVIFDSNITITNLIESLEKYKPINPKGISSVMNYYDQFGSAQWKNSTSFQDAVSQTSDVRMPFTIFGKEVLILSLVHEAADEMEFNIQGKSSAVEKFLLSGSALVLKASFVWPDKNEIVRFQRISCRKGNSKLDILGVLRLLPEETEIKKCTLVLYDSKRNWFEASNVEENIVGKHISNQLFDDIEEDINVHLENISNDFWSLQIKNIIKVSMQIMKVKVTYN